MATILIVEDHDTLRKSIKSTLESEGFIVITADTLAMALLKLNEHPDLVVLDWMLPDGQGIDFLSQIKQYGRNTPVIFLTARSETFDKVLALELGASDYLTKPFETRELIARIRVRLRELNLQLEKNETNEKILKIGALIIDRIKHKVSFKNSEVDLVKKEYDLLLIFAENPEKLFSRDELLNKVWGYDVFPTTRTVDTHVMLLRQKLDGALIETVRSVGYRFKSI